MSTKKIVSVAVFALMFLFCWQIGLEARTHVGFSIGGGRTTVRPGYVVAPRPVYVNPYAVYPTPYYEPVVVYPTVPVYNSGWSFSFWR